MKNKAIVLFIFLLGASICWGQSPGDSLLTVYQETGDLEVLEKALGYLAEPQPEKGLKLGRELEKNAKDQGNSELVISGLIYQTYSFRSLYQLDSALVIFDRIIDYASAHDLSESVVDAYMGKSSAYSLLSEEVLAIQAILDGLVFAEQKGLRQMQIGANIQLAANFYQFDQPKALRYLGKAQSLMNDSTSVDQRNYANTILGYTYCFQKEYDKATTQARINLKASTNPFVTLESLSLLERCYRETELRDSSLHYALMIIDTARTYGMTPHLISHLAKSGLDLIALGRHEEAVLNCRQAFAMVKNQSNAGAYYDACQCLGNAFQKLEMTDSTLHYQSKTLQWLRNEFESSDKEMAVQKELGYFYRLDSLQKVKEITEEKAATDRAESRSLWIFAVSILALLVMVGVVLFAMNRNKIIRQQKALLDQEYINLKEFTENASHEMQTPMAVMLSKLDNLLKLENLTETQVQEVSTVVNASRRVSQMNQELLLLFRIENRQFPLDQQVDVSASVSQYLEWFSELIKNNNLTLHRNIAPSVTVASTKLVLDRMVSNLLKNSISHNVDGGYIKVTVNQEQLIISNSGEPLKTDPDRLFERFFKNNPSSSGSGLGLAIVKRACDAHDWDISYHYEGGEHTISITF